MGIIKENINDMKKITIFAALCALVMGGCAENNLDNIAPEENTAITLPDLTAGFAEDATKTYVEEGKYLRWHEADLISAFYGNTLNRQYKFKGQTGDNSGTFSLVPSGELGTGNELSAIYAIYPYDENATITDKGVMTINLPATQTYAENSFGKGANTMLAVTESVEDTFLGFKNACGYLKLKLYNESGAMLKSVEVKGNNGEKIAGSATATIEFGGVPAVAMNNDATTSVTLDCGEGIALGTTAETATELWIVLPETTFEGGITITATDTEGVTFEKSTTNPVAIIRNEIQPMKALETVFEVVIPETWKIYYTATAKVEPYKTNIFGANYVSNDWDKITKEGVITFDGDVTLIGQYAFKGCSYLTTINVPESVTSIEYRAFYGCDSLINIAIPEHITWFGEGAFYGCKNLSEFKGKHSSIDGRCWVVNGTLVAFAPAGLTEYIIPNSITSIGRMAFSYCENLTQVTIPQNITKIGASAFYGCSNLESITIPQSVTMINDETFRFCSKLTSITIPNSIVSIGTSAFYGCSSLVNIAIPNSVTSIGSSAFAGCFKVTSVTIPNSVTSIGSYAFSECGGTITIDMTSIPAGKYWEDDSNDPANFLLGSYFNTLVLGENVNMVGECAFDGDWLFDTIYCKAKTPPTVEQFGLGSSPIFCKIYVPYNSVNTYKAAYYWSKYASRIVGYNF